MTPVVVVLLFLAPLLIKVSPKTVASTFMDCSDIAHQNPDSPSGVYRIYPSGYRLGVPVYCDMDTERGSWTVFQRRIDGSVNFFRRWEHYVAGFGDVEGEHWLGLELIHKITARGKYELLVEMEDFDGNKAFARYSSFSVGGDCDGYKLSVSGFTDGGAGDSLTYHNGIKFSTYDKDQDTYGTNCALLQMGAFWFRNCFRANPNSVYFIGDEVKGFPNRPGVLWMSWKGIDYSLKSFSFKMRPVQ